MLEKANRPDVSLRPEAGYVRFENNINMAGWELDFFKELVKAREEHQLGTTSSSHSLSLKQRQLQTHETEH